MKYNLFISYSSSDQDKVEIVARELADDPLFDPVIIAFNREPLKPLAQKVIDGIVASRYVIPILTKQSIGTQWINQEIGFARGIDRKIAPIIEKSILHDLKGFIHREVDLPYSYKRDDDPKVENQAFLNEFRNLIRDLGRQEPSVEPSVRVLSPSQTEFERALEALDKDRGARAFEQQKEAFFRSSDGARAATDQYEQLVEIATEGCEAMKGRGLDLAYERHSQRPSFVVRCAEHSLSFALETVHTSNRPIFNLSVIHWKGYRYTDPNAFYFDRPERMKEWTYEADLTSSLNVVWTDAKSKSTKDSKTIVDESLSWIVQVALKN